MIDMKRCPTCAETKPLDAFGKKARTLDGRCCQCRACVAAYDRRRKADPVARERMRESSRVWRRRPEVRARLAQEKRAVYTAKAETIKAAARAQRATHPEKHRAHNAVKDALERGDIVRRPCIVCGDLKAEAHHPDYARPLDVIWYCRPHHRQHHAELKKAANG